MKTQGPVPETVLEKRALLPDYATTEITVLIVYQRGYKR